MDIGRKILHLRQKAMLTQDDLAKKVGLSRVTITSIEQGKRKVLAEELTLFSEALGCSYKDFFTEAQHQPESTTTIDEELIPKLYKKYKERHLQPELPPVTLETPLDDYLRDINPYYYPSSNNEVRYEQ